MFGMFGSDAIVALASLLSLAENGKGADSPPPVTKIVKPLYSTGRNNKCPCNSGKKFKFCCIDKKLVIEVQSKKNEVAQ